MEFVVRIVLVAGSSLSSGSSLSQDRPCCQDRPYRQDRPCRQDCPLTIDVESRLVTIEVGFRSGSSCDDEVSVSNDEVEFL